ncbi:MAG: formate dehydrogenase accessory protein FdhE [Desulfovibrionales bacterium]|nr:formate dehydrogenase accessory protein FdhE [Desulfovibrionales bacterium]
MSNTAALEDATQSITQTLDAACTRHPALESLMHAFAPVLTIRTELVAAITETLRQAPDHPVHAIATTTTNDVILLAEHDISWAVEFYPLMEERLFPVLAGLNTFAADIDTFSKEAANEPELVVSLLTALLNGNKDALEALASTFHLPVEKLHFIGHQMLCCVLGAVTAIHSEALRSLFWRESYCPVCGSFPDISTHQRPDVDQSEYLAGGGGKKMMHCPTCDHQWHFRRGTCPACGNEDTGAIHYFHVDGNVSERVEYCTSCNHYLLNIDLRNIAKTPDLRAAPLTLLHLDILAQEKKLSPLYRSLFNTF